MPEVLIPLTFEDLPVKPSLRGRPRISEDLQQTIALLTGWDKHTRRLVAVNPFGMLQVVSPDVKGIINFQADGDADTWQGSDISTSEVLVRAKPSNSGRIWASVGIAAAVDVGYPLDAGEWVTFSIISLQHLHLHFTKDDNWVIVIYTK